MPLASRRLGGIVRREALVPDRGGCRTTASERGQKERPMRTRHVVQLALLTGILVMGVVPGTVAPNVPDPETAGVVATITSIDAKHGMATLKVDGGEVFELPKGRSWKVGDKVLCDRIGNGLRLPRLQDCKP